MKLILTQLAAVVLSLGLSTAAIAQDHAQHVRTDAAPSTEAPVTMASGEVRKVDRNPARLTVKHGPLANLNMPGMTMVYKVKDPAMLDQVKVGDKINFVAEKVDGSFILTKLVVKNS